MECKTSYGKDKVKYNTLEEAIAVCKILNKQEKRIHKLVPYKCWTCFKFHVGSNGKLLKKENNIYANV